jgi:hypothetical protein
LNPDSNSNPNAEACQNNSFRCLTCSEKRSPRTAILRAIRALERVNKCQACSDRHCFRNCSVRDSRTCAANVDMIDNIFTTSVRPSIDSYVDKFAIRWLADSGAAISVLDYAIFQRLQNSRTKPFVSAPNKFKVIRGATGHSFNIIGTFMMPIKIGNKLIPHPICVVENLPTKAILGVDFLTAVGALIDFQKGKVKVPPYVSNIEALSAAVDEEFLCAAESYKIPAGTKRVIAVRLETKTEPLELPQDGLVSVLPKNQSPIEAVESLITLREGKGFMVVNNPSLTERELPRFQRLAIWTPLEKNQIAELGEVTKNNLTALIAQPLPPLDPKKKEFIEKNAKIQVTGEKRQKILDLLLKYHDVISVDGSDLGRSNAISHEIHLKSQAPVHQKQFRIPWEHRKVIDEYVDKLLEKGCIQPSRSPFNAPLFCVKKPHGHGLRVVQDFRGLNAASYEDKYVIREVHDCTDQVGLRKSVIFSTLDLTSGFWQLNLEEKSRPYTAFTVPGRGRFEWTTTPMGLHGAPSSFARLMDIVMSGLDGILTYIDDVLAHSPDFETHLKDLEQALLRLRQFTLKLNLAKCEFGTTEVNYLGFTLTEKGIKPGKEKLQAVQDFPEPETPKSIREFTGLANYFRHMIPNYSLKSGQLSKLLQKDHAWKGGKLPPESRKAFQELKEALCSAPVLVYPRADRPFSLMVDAATGDQTKPGGLGAVLLQTDDQGLDRVIAYASRTLNKSEKNYSAFLLETLAATWAIEHFATYLTGRKFTLYTDHKPLEKLNVRHQKTLSRLQQQMNEFNFIVKHKAGAENVIADALSRNPVAFHHIELGDNRIDIIDPEDNCVPKLFTKREFHQAQLDDHFCSSIIAFLKGHDVGEHDLSIMGCALTKSERQFAESCFLDSQGIVNYVLSKPKQLDRDVFVAPEVLKRRILETAHVSRFSGHTGIFKLIQRVTSTYFWPGLANDAKKFVESCKICQKSKDPPKFVKTHAPLETLPLATAPNQRCHIDLFGPLDTVCQGKRYIMVMTDAFSKYAVIRAIPDKQAETVANCFFDSYICKFSCPSRIVTDGGKEFINRLFKQLCKKLGIQTSKTSALHPQTNSQAESFNRTIIKYMQRMLSDRSTLEWVEWLPALELCYNTQVHEATMHSPFFLTFLREPQLPLFDLHKPDYGEDFTSETLRKLKIVYGITRENLESQDRKIMSQSSKTAVNRSFEVGDKVLLYYPKSSFKDNPKFAQKWTGPWIVTEKIGNLTYVVAPQHNSKLRPTTVHIDRLKRFIVEGEESRDEKEVRRVRKTKSQSLSTPDVQDSSLTLPDSDEPQQQQALSSAPSYASVAARGLSNSENSSSQDSPVLTRQQARLLGRTVPEYPWVSPIQPEE